MQQQEYRSRPEAAATEKQIGFIRDLQGRDLISEKVDFDDLTKREASAMIDLALSQAKRDLMQKFEETSESEIIIEGDDDVGSFEENVEDDLEPEPEVKPQEKLDFGVPIGKVDKIRLGLSAKLVFNKHEHNHMTPGGRNEFKAEAKAMYGLLAELEQEMSGE